MKIKLPFLALLDLYRAFLYVGIALLPVVCFAGNSNMDWDRNYSSGLGIIWANVGISIVIVVALFIWLVMLEDSGEALSVSIAKFCKFGFFISAVSVLIGLSDMPPEYYFFYLRMVLFVTALLILLSLHNENENSSIGKWILLGCVILYNPIIPIILHSKISWVVLNLLYLVFICNLMDGIVDRELSSDWFESLKHALAFTIALGVLVTVVGGISWYYLNKYNSHRNDPVISSSINSENSSKTTLTTDKKHPVQIRSNTAQSPPSVNFFRQRGKALANKHKWRLLMVQCERWIDYYPSDPAAWKYYGVALLKLGMLNKSLKAFQNGITYAPNDKSMIKLIAGIKAKLLQSKIHTN